MNTGSNQDRPIELGFSQRLKDLVRSTATWARVAAICSFITTAYILVTNISKGGFLQVFIVLIITAVYVIMAVYLFNFGNLTKRGFDNIDQDDLENGLNNLRMYFKMTVRVLIGFIILFGIIILFAVLGSNSLLGG
ncbi:MAG TPA: hypothetical protein VG738_04090 [Chitinophagaceae bacterium]|nr:hypothetical protein [Chitinophagaceae bacterium]